MCSNEIKLRWGLSIDFCVTSLSFVVFFLNTFATFVFDQNEHWHETSLWFSNNEWTSARTSKRHKNVNIFIIYDQSQKYTNITIRVVFFCLLYCHSNRSRLPMYSTLCLVLFFPSSFQWSLFSKLEAALSNLFFSSLLFIIYYLCVKMSL